jgi:hypothetical protein
MMYCSGSNRIIGDFVFGLPDTNFFNQSNINDLVKVKSESETFEKKDRHLRRSKSTIKDHPLRYEDISEKYNQ